LDVLKGNARRQQDLLQLAVLKQDTARLAVDEPVGAGTDEHEQEQRGRTGEQRPAPIFASFLHRLVLPGSEMAVSRRGSRVASISGSGIPPLYGSAFARSTNGASRQCGRCKLRTLCCAIVC